MRAICQLAGSGPEVLRDVGAVRVDVGRRDESTPRDAHAGATVRPPHGAWGELDRLWRVRRVPLAHSRKWKIARPPAGGSYGRSRTVGRSRDSQTMPARQWQISRELAAAAVGGLKPAPRRKAISPARPANGGHGSQTSIWARTNLAHASPISEALAASR